MINSAQIQTVKERIWSKVPDLAYLTDEDCWIFNGYITNEYGKVFFNGRSRSITRVVYWIYKDLCQSDLMLRRSQHLVVCHKCDNPLCLNPSHLFLGTVLDNVRDKISKGRAVNVKGESHGRNTTLTEAQVRAIKAEYTGKRGEQRALARKYGTHFGHINAILLGKTWKHVK
jgi:hypothetical protein